MEGRIIELVDGRIVARRDAGVPRGLVILKRDGETVEVVDLAKSGDLDRAIARLMAAGDAGGP